MKPLIFLLALFQVHYVFSQTFECPPPWEEFSTKCYHFELRAASPEEAENSCHHDSAKLLSVNNREENEFIGDWLRKNRQADRKWFTSGRRTGTGDSFYWEGDGTDIQGYQFWLPGGQEQPGDAIVYFTDGAIFGWTLAELELERPFICEIPRVDVHMIINIQRGFDFGASNIDLAALHRGPIFTTQPVNTIYDTEADIGHVAMECDASGNPAPTYKWMVWIEQRPQEINPQTHDRYTITNGRLIITQPDLNLDNGEFQCIAENEYGSILSDKVQLTFAYLQNFPKSRRDPVEVSAFSGIGIPCSPPVHKTSLTFAWYKNEYLNFIRSEQKPYTFISNDGSLYFEHATEDDEGLYYCMIKMQGVGRRGGEGKVSMPIALTVSTATSNEQEPTMFNGFPRLFPPNPKKGDVVRIECVAQGSDELFYSWYKVGGSLPGNSILMDHNRVILIQDLELVHAGEYICSVERQNGLETTGSVTLTIDAAPYFTIPLEHQHVDLGADLSWQCIAHGVPNLEYSWYKNAEPFTLANIPPEQRDRYVLNHNVLEITNINHEDAAMYQCGAENLHAIHYSAAQLRVLAFAPTFGKLDVQPNTYASLRGNVTIVCQPEAAPVADLVWKKNNRLISESNRIRQLGNGNLYITAVTQSDEGYYSCEATNSLGSAASGGNLTVLSQTLINYYPSATTTVHINHTAFLPCQASYNPLLDLTYTWLQNNRLVEFEKIKFMSNKVYIQDDPYFYRGSGINKGGLFIRNTQFMHAGEYTCLATTTRDHIAITAKLIVVGPPGPPAGVQGENPTQTTIDLFWYVGADHGRPITSYIVEGFNEDEGRWREFKSNIIGTEMRNRRTTVEGLASFSNYVFRMRAVNELGVGEPSLATTSFTTSPSVPEFYPNNIGGGGGVVGLLTITWDSMPRYEHNGEGFGYRVYWKRAAFFNEEYDMVELSGAHHNRHVVTVGDDKYYLKYDITVQAFNDEGDGPRPDDVTIYSAEGMPIGVPLEVRARPYNGTALRVYWKEVENTRESMKGVLLGYRINYWKEFGEEEIQGIYNIIPGQTNNGLIIGLESHVYYIVRVQAYNSAGTGPKSEIFREETLRAAPKNQPTEVRVEVIDHDSVRVMFRGVSTDNSEEPLQGYMVKYWRQGESMNVAKLADAEKKTNIKIHGLDSDTVYNVRVYGYSRGGEGLSSSPTVHFILGPECDEVGDNPQARYMYGCRGCTIQSSMTLATVLLILQIVWNYVR